MSNGVSRIIDASAVSKIVSTVGLTRIFDLALERLEAVLRDFNEGSVDMRERDGFTFSHPQPGLLEWMPAVRHGSAAIIKIVSYHPANPDKYALPTILSVIQAFDVATGHLRCVLEGTFATAIRTGAASALASRLLADPGAETLGIIGCGAQAVTQLHALSRVFAFRRVLVSDVDSGAEQSFATRARVTPGLVEVASRADVERNADILCTVTSVSPGYGPVISGDETRLGVHINSVGSDMPGKSELPQSLLQRAVVCPDHRAQAMREGECQYLRPDQIGPSIFTLVRQPELAASLRNSLTVYDSTGLALQDLAMAELFADLAETCGVGLEARLEATAADPRDPFGFIGDMPATIIDGRSAGAGARATNANLAF